MFLRLICTDKDPAEFEDDVLSAADLCVLSIAQDMMFGVSEGKISQYIM